MTKGVVGGGAWARGGSSGDLGPLSREGRGEAGMAARMSTCGYKVLAGWNSYSSWRFRPWEKEFAKKGSAASRGCW